jgi:hypothetical protein
MSAEEPVFYQYEDKYGNQYNMTFTKSYYTNNEGLAVIMWNQEPDDGYLEEYATLTVNLGELSDPELAYVDTNNLGDDIIGWLEDNGIATFAGDYMQSGYCEFPLVRFAEEFLEETPTEEY